MEYNDLLGWTFDLQQDYLTNTQTAGAGTNCWLARIPLPAPLTVTNVCVGLSVIGVTLVHSYVGLYKSNGVLIGQSADQSTAWAGSPGFEAIALAGGPFTVSAVAANDFVWGVINVGSAVTAPAFWGVTGFGSGYYGNFGTTAARSRSGYIAMGNVTTLTTIVPANIRPWAFEFWMALS
jgi:hypothetical protein